MFCALLTGVIHSHNTYTRYGTNQSISGITACFEHVDANMAADLSL